MSVIGRWPVILFCLLACGFYLQAQGATAAPLPASGKTLPKLVRLSLVEGDVRVSRGKLDGRGDTRDLGAVWEKAEVNLTIEPGFSVAASTGRAEIRFEDGSTMYLDQNSLMSFGKLSSRRESVDLVSGTLSLNLHPVRGGLYRVTTPTDQMQVTYPDRAAVRVTAYVDGTAVAALGTATIHMDSDATDLAPKEVRLWRGGKSLDATMVQDTSGLFTAWDAWVAQRIASGEAAVIPADYTMPDVSRLALTGEPTVIPRTVSQASLPNSNGTYSSPWDVTNSFPFSPVLFNRLFQSFEIFYQEKKGSKTSIKGELVGGGPSAIHRGKGGSIRRNVDIPQSSRIGDYFPG